MCLELPKAPKVIKEPIAPVNIEEETTDVELGNPDDDITQRRRRGATGRASLLIPNARSGLAIPSA